MAVRLGIETTSLKASLALASDETLITERSSDRQRSHSEFVTRALEEMLLEHKLKISDVTEISVSVGPGSFTGIRVGISLAKTLGYALNRPLWTVTSSQSLFSSLKIENQNVICVQNAFKNLFFVHHFGNLQRTEQPIVMAIEELIDLCQRSKIAGHKTQLIGDAQELVRPSLPVELVSQIEFRSDFFYPTAKDLLLLRKSNPNLGQTKDWKSILPLYLRASEAEENLRIKSSEIE